MKAFPLLTLAFLLSSGAQAAPRILQGDWEVGGSLNFTHASLSTSSASSNVFAASAMGQHFFADEFSAGLELGLGATSGTTIVRAGPVATKYLLTDDKLAPYVSMLPILVNTRTGDSAVYSSKLRVGAKYFLTDSVAFGPAAEYEHIWDSDSAGSGNIFSFLALFSIHL